MEIKAEEITSKNKWEKYVSKFKPNSFLQSWNWGETNKLTGSDVIRYAFIKGETLLGVSQYIVQRAKRGPHILVPGGPFLDWKNEKLVNFYIEFSQKLATQKGCWFVRVRPEILADNHKNNLLDGKGIVSSNMHLHAENTWILDLSPTLDELLSGMRKTTRYLVKKSMDKDITVSISDNAKDIKYLTALQKDTVKRHKFVGFSRKLFEAQMQTFGADGEAKIFTVFYKNKAMASAIIIFYSGYAYYHHSGSSEEARHIPASYRLQWEVIKYAKENGIKKYNFWGIAPSNNPKHRFHGVTVFKTGFGGYGVNWVHAHDIICSPLYYLTYAFEYFRKTFRRL